MTALTYDLIKIESAIKLKTITHVDLRVVKNEHATLNIRGIADDGVDAYKQLTGRNLHTPLTLYSTTDHESPIYCGLIEMVSLFRQDDIDYFEISVVSGSKLMDKIKKKRSFQDVQMTYEELVTQIVNEYPDGATICTVGQTQKIGIPLVQYDETDWEFLKRLASHFDGVIVPETTECLPRLWFGFPEKTAEAEFDTDSYTWGQTEDFYTMGGSLSKYQPVEFQYIDVDIYTNYHLGNYTNFQNSVYLLYEKHATIKKGELVFTYRFGASGLGLQPTYYNEKISGMSLQGTVVQTQTAVVNVKLDIDDGAGGTYPYPWRPETGNMMYCMPIVGTKVSLYFPNFNEQKAMVTNSYRTNGSECEQMTDTTKREFVTEHNKAMNVFPTAMSFVNSTSSIMIDDTAGIILYAQHSISLRGSEINIIAPLINVIATVGEINLVKLARYDAVASSVMICNQFDILADSVTKLIGRDFGSYSAFSDTPASGKFEWGKLFGNVLAGLAVVALVAAVVVTGGAALVAVGAIAATTASAAVTGAVVGGILAVGMTAGFDMLSGEVSDMKEYMFSGLSGSITGAISGGISVLKLGKFAKIGLEVGEGVITGAGESIASQMFLEDKDFGDLNWGSVGFNGLLNGGIAGAVPVIGEIPFVKKMRDKLGSLLSKGGKGAGDKLLGDAGKFTDDLLENDYQKYVKRNTKAGKTVRDRADWKKASDYYTKESPLARGNDFNKTAKKQYQFNEVHLANGKRLDSYDPVTGEIISRKATNLDEISENTYRKYLSEIESKYAVGTEIRSNTYPDIDGKVLQGEYILEIPATNANSSNIDRYKEIAAEYNVKLKFLKE